MPQTHLLNDSVNTVIPKLTNNSLIPALEENHIQTTMLILAISSKLWGVLSNIISSVYLFLQKHLNETPLSTPKKSHLLVEMSSRVTQFSSGTLHFVFACAPSVYNFQTFLQSN